MPFPVTAACPDVRILNRQTAEVEVQPERKKVAIVGFASNTLHLVPWQDPAYEIWGLNQGHVNFQRRADRWFEMHLPEYTEDVRDPEYLKFLTECPVPVYMIEAYEQYPSSVRYPIEAAIAYAGRDYFGSSVAFMLAIAALEEMERVDIYGVNLAIGDEYFYEKPNAEWWIGLLQGRGISVNVPYASSLLKQPMRYGYSAQRTANAMTKVLLTGRSGEYDRQAAAKLNEYHILIGAKRECDALQQIAEGLDRGADIVLMTPAQPPAAQTT